MIRLALSHKAIVLIYKIVIVHGLSTLILHLFKAVFLQSPFIGNANK